MSNQDYTLTMGIKVPTGFVQRFEKELQKQIFDAQKALIYELAYIGMEAVNTIRQNHAYEDQTGNLTSSVGYAIIVDGKIVQASDFTAIKPTAMEGSKVGRQMVNKLASQYPQGITLIVVAGMNYAAYVERRGIGGMTGGEMYARQMVTTMLEQLESGINAYSFSSTK